MQRNELITITATSMDCELEQVEKIIDAFIDTIVIALKTQERIELRTDFGSFVVRKKGQSSAQKTTSISKVRKVVSFKATPSLKKELLESDEEFIAKLKQRDTDIKLEKLKTSRRDI